MKVHFAITLLILCACSTLSIAQPPTSSPRPLHRQYREGERLAYHMKGVNEDWHYEIDAQGVVKKDAAGRFYEEYQWTNMTSGGQPLSLAPSAAAYRQKLTLDPAQIPSAPDLTNADSRMIGPITDLMTFYVDLWLPAKLGVLRKAGDHFYFHNPMPPSSWADGRRVLVGQDAIDFDMTLKSVDSETGAATVEVRHLPPQKSTLPLKAAWMQQPVATAPNNWVEITRDANGKYDAGVGLETFTVQLTVSLSDGHILNATMENPVTTIQRVCEDEALTRCGEPIRHEILRKVEIAIKQ